MNERTNTSRQANIFVVVAAFRYELRSFVSVSQRQWLLILEEAKRKKMALDNQRKETAALQHDSLSSDAPRILGHFIFR